jgi:hypothetical protein
VVLWNKAEQSMGKGAPAPACHRRREQRGADASSSSLLVSQ